MAGLDPYLLRNQANGGGGRSPFDAYFQAREQRNAFEKYERQNKARDLAGQYLTGNKAVAEELARTDPGSFMDAQKFQRQEAAEEAGRIASILYAANTPEKYAQATAALKAEGHAFDPGEDAWENREKLIAEGMTVAQQIAKANSDRDFAFKERDFAADQDYRNRSLSLQEQRLAQGNGQRVPMGYRMTADGNLEPIPGGPADPNKPMPQRTFRPTTDQSNAAGFYDRLVEADKVIQQHGLAGTDYKQNLARDYAPFGTVPYLMSPEFQLVDQAQRNFVNAVLRKESGAAISESEFDNARRQYFPQPGDTPEVIEQKARNRQTVIEAMRRTGAPALQQGQQQGQVEGLPGMEQGNADIFLQQAREAIQQGADPEAVRQRLEELGIDPSQLQ